MNTNTNVQSTVEDPKTNGLHTSYKKPAPVFNSDDFLGYDIPGHTDSENKFDAVEEKTLAEFETYRITKEKSVPDTHAVIMFGESKIAAADNITPITAESKAGKTALKNVFIAGAISTTGTIDGFDNVRVIPNPEGKAVIDFDTEQSEADQQYNLRTALKRAGLESTPDNYHSYNIRTLGIKEYQTFTDHVCRLCSEKYNGVHMILIDGGADYIASVNDETEANAIIAYFTKLAVTYNCPVILVVHLNENAGKNTDTMPRGHIGRQAVRKGYCQLNITKEGDISTVQALRARRAGVADTPLICFQYSKEKGYHVSIDAETLEAARQNNKDMAGRKKAEKIAAKIFSGTSSYTFTDSINKIMKETSKSKPTAKRYLDDMQGWGIVRKEDGFYYLNTQGS